MASLKVCCKPKRLKIQPYIRKEKQYNVNTAEYLALISSYHMGITSLELCLYTFIHCTLPWISSNYLTFYVDTSHTPTQTLKFSRKIIASKTRMQWSDEMRLPANLFPRDNHVPVESHVTWHCGSRGIVSRDKAHVTRFIGSWVGEWDRSDLVRDRIPWHGVYYSTPAGITHVAMVTKPS